MTHRYLKVLVPLLLSLAAVAAPAKEQARQGSGLYLVEFTVGPNWKADLPPPQQEGFAGHSENLSRLHKAGVLLFGARYGDKGVVLLKVADEAAARAELEPDPSLAAGVFQAAVFEFRPFYTGEVPRSGHPPVAEP